MFKIYNTMDPWHGSIELDVCVCHGGHMRL